MLQFGPSVILLQREEMVVSGARGTMSSTLVFSREQSRALGRGSSQNLQAKDAARLELGLEGHQ